MEALQFFLTALPWVLVLLLVINSYLSWKVYSNSLRTIKKHVVSAVKDDWGVLTIGVTDQKLETAWLRAAQFLFQSFARKNHDYGSGNLAAGGVRGIALRLGDKVSRLWQLTGLRGRDSKAQVTSEAIADTFLDIANYGLVGYLMSVGKWPAGSISQSIGGKAIATLVVSALGDLERDTQDDVLAAVYTAQVAKDIAGASIVA